MDYVFLVQVVGSTVLSFGAAYTIWWYVWYYPIEGGNGDE